MTTPAEAALRFVWGLALGMVLGAVYDFLRPLRKKRNAPADLLFVLIAFQVWIYLSFGICKSDIRIDITAALVIGAICWLNTAGKVVRPVFRWFWLGIFQLLALFLSPIKKILKKIAHFRKKCLHMGKKGVQ